MLCPFSAYPVDVIPAYCNIVQAGSKYDLTSDRNHHANDRFVGTDATNPVVLNYDIKRQAIRHVTGTDPGKRLCNGIPQSTHQEARGNGTAKAEDLVYNEQSVQGHYRPSPR